MLPAELTLLDPLRPGLTGLCALTGLLLANGFLELSLILSGDVQTKPNI